MRILRGLSSRLLPCGCVAGIYETYDGHVVTLLDERQSSCTVPEHAQGDELVELAEPLATPSPTPADRTTRRH